MTSQSSLALTLAGVVVLHFLWKSFRHSAVKLQIRNLPGPAPQSWSKGNFGQLFSTAGMPFHQEIAKYGSATKIHGLVGDEQVYFTDPRAIHQIVVKDQYIFEETDMFIKTNHLLFGVGLLSTLGEHHKKQRKLLNPVFSINHMRNLTPIFYDITHQLCHLIDSKVTKGEETIDMLNWMSRVALELIGQGGLGYSFDALDENKQNEYSDSIKDLVPTTFPLIVYRQFLPFMMSIGPASFRRHIVDLLPSKRVQKLKRMVDIMDRTSSDVLLSKERALAAGDEAVLKQVGQGKDIMSALLRVNDDADEADRLHEKEIHGQMTTLIFAAHDTTSSAMARILHQLALHPEAQERLREEIIEAQDTYSDLPYDELSALPFLEAVCRETLRLFPPIPTVSRTARKATVVGLSRPVMGTDGKLIHEIPIAENQNVIIGITAVNKDPETWGPDAEEWKPERWLAPLPETVTGAHIPGVYANLMTFLGGGRACIGFKFSQLEMKVVLALLLKKFRFAPAEEEIVWKLGSIITPSSKGKEHEKPHLPLKVSLV